jgi:6-phosphofructokinase
MKICIIGGIFDKPAAYRATVWFTPESVLADALRERGHEVTTRGHLTREPFSGFDVVHAHQLGRGAVEAATSLDPAPMVFTRHGWSEESPLRAAALRYVLRLRTPSWRCPRRRQRCSVASSESTATGST